MTPSKTLFCLCISFVVGIFLESLIKIPQVFIWGILFLGVLITLFSLLVHPLFVRIRDGLKVNSVVFGFCVLFLALGILRVQISEFTILSDKLAKLNDRPEKITLTGQIIAEPDIRDTSQKLKVKIGENLVLVTAARYPEYKYLDTIKITGKLKTPPEFEDFNYKNYLMKDGIYSVMDYPKVELVYYQNGRSSVLVVNNFFSFLYEKILFVKGKLMDSVSMNFSPPQDSILQGVVYGNDKNMPKDVKDEFNATGLSHLTAVSGSNIIILIDILMGFLLFLGLWRQQASYWAIGLIWFYIVLIGLPVSGIRAAIMGSIMLLAGILGRQNASARALVLAGALMLLQNPLLLLYDVSFQLSFLASLGIIYAKPLIDYSLQFSRDFSKKYGFKFIVDILSITFAAQVFALPIIVYNFGTLPLISPVTNVLVLPIIPWLTILGFLVSIVGVFSNALGFIFSLPCMFLLAYMIKILEIFSQPWAVKTIANIHWLWLVLYYVLLSILIWYLNKKHKPKFLGY